MPRLTVFAFLAALMLLVAILLPSAASAATGPSGATYRTFTSESAAQSACGTPAAAFVAWIAGDKYYRANNPQAGAGNGTWSCFSDAVVAGFQTTCTSPDQMVWVDPNKKTWAINGSSAYKSGVGGFMCLSDALGLNFTQALATGEFSLLLKAELVKCTPPDQLVWLTPADKSFVAPGNPNYGSGTGGYICRNLAELNGYRYKAGGVSTPDAAGCKLPDVAVWVNKNDNDFFAPGSDGYRVHVGEGAYMCQSDALKAGDKDASKNVVGQFTPDALMKSGWCNSADHAVWVSFEGSGYMVTLHDPKAGQGKGLWVCGNDANKHGYFPQPTLWTTAAAASCPGDKVVWVINGAQQYAEKGQWIQNAYGFGDGNGHYMCELVAIDYYYTAGSSTAPVRATWPVHNFYTEGARCQTGGGQLAWIIQGGSIAPHKSLLAVSGQTFGDIYAGQVGPGDWVCLSEAIAQGYPLDHLASPKAADVHCSDETYYIADRNTGKPRLLSSSMPDYGKGWGPGYYICKSTAIAFRMQLDVPPTPAPPIVKALPMPASCSQVHATNWLQIKFPGSLTCTYDLDTMTVDYDTPLAIVIHYGPKSDTFPVGAGEQMGGIAFRQDVLGATGSLSSDLKVALARYVYLKAHH